MSNAFTNFLSAVGGGLFADTGYLKDYKHASRLYVDNYYGMSPKAGWSYFVEIGLNPDLWDENVFESIDSTWYNRSKGKLGLMAKSADLPRFTISNETLNQYNKKTVVQTKIVYNPISITFHDDMDNMITDLWKNYYQYYYADSRYTGFNQLTRSQANMMPTPYNKSAMFLTQYENRGFAYGLNNGQTEPFMHYIKIFLINRRKYSSVTLINPIITEWSHAQLDQTTGNRLLDAKMTVSYEAVYYDTGNHPVTKTQPGFNSLYYDNSPSPLSALGRGTKGLLGMVTGASDVLDVLGKEGPLGVGDIINATIGISNVVKNAQSIKGGAAKAEAYGMLYGALGNAARGMGTRSDQAPVSGPAAVSLTKPSTDVTEAKPGTLK